MGDFDYSAFWEKANRLFDLLEELHGIDAVLDGIESRGLSELYYPPSNYTGGGPFNTRISLGTTHPFEETIRAVDVETSGGGYPFSSSPTTTTSAHDFGWVDEAYSAASSWRVSAQGSFGHRVEPLIKVDPSGFRDVAYALVDLYATLKTNVDADWSGLSTQSSEWEGEAADTFFLNFQVPFSGIVENHRFVIDYLNSLVCAVKACNDAGQQSLLNLVDEAVNLADQQLQKRQNDSRASDTVEALLLGTAVTGIAAALTFPVPGVSAALGSVSALLEYAASEVPPDNAELRSLTASSATEIESALDSELTQLRANVKGALDGVEGKCDELDEYVGNMKAGDVLGSKVNSWIPIQPDAVPGPDWYHESRS